MFNRHSTPYSYKPGGFKEFFSIAFPLVISNVSITLMHFVDRLFLSWSSPEEIAACIPAGTFSWALLSVFIGISEYTNTFVAQFYGAQQYPSIGRATWQGIFFSLFCGLCSLLLLPFGIILFNYIGHPPEIVVFEKQYFWIIYTGGTFIILKESLSSFYSGRGKTKIIMIVNIIANGMNCVLDYFLIFGIPGYIAPMGIRGAALATVISIIFACLAFLFLFLMPSNALRYHTRKIRVDWILLKRMIRFGAPSGIQFFLEVSSFTVFVFIIGGLGKIELAASNIAMSISALAWLPMLGAGMATAILVGQYIGRQNIKIAEKSAYTALFSVEVYMIFFALVYLCFPNQLISLFQSSITNPDVPYEEIQRYGKTILFLVAVYQIGDAMNISFSGALRGAGDTSFAMWTNVFCSWIFFVPGTVIIVTILQKGLIGAWIWAGAYITLLGFVFWFRFRMGKWKTIRLIPAENQ